MAFDIAMARRCPFIQRIECMCIIDTDLYKINDQVDLVRNCDLGQIDIYDIKSKLATAIDDHLKQQNFGNERE